MAVSYTHLDVYKRQDQSLIPQLLGKKAAEKTSEGNAEEEQRCEAGGGVGMDAAALHQIAAGPEPGCLLQGAICEKSHQN